MPGRDATALEHLFGETAFDRRAVYRGAEIEGRNPVCDRVLSYWCARLGAGGLVPRRSIRPEELRDVLPHLVLLDLTQASAGALEAVTVRLIGTHVASYYGEITGHDIRAMRNSGAAERIYDAVAQAAAYRAPLLTFVSGLAPEQRHIDAHALYLPLTGADGETETATADKMLVAVDVRLGGG